MAVQAIGMIGMGALLVLIFLRVPVGIAMGLVGFFGYASIDGWWRAFSVLGQAPYDVAAGYTLSVIPLFIVMGDIALRAGMSAKLYDAARSLFFGIRGSQAYATIGACAGFGAICGSSLATAATMTRIAIPQMRRAGYDDRTLDRLSGGRWFARYPHSTVDSVRCVCTHGPGIGASSLCGGTDPRARSDRTVHAGRRRDHNSQAVLGPRPRR